MKDYIDEVSSEKGRFHPLPADQPVVGMTCPGCHQIIEPGDIPSIVNPTREDIGTGVFVRHKDDDGWFNAEAQIAHQRCAYPEDADG